MFYVFSTPQSLAQHLSNLLIQRIQQKPNIVLGLATGSTMEPVYGNFVQRIKQDNVDLSQVRSYNLDEYIGLPPEHEQSYHFFMNQNLFSLVNMKPEQLHLPSGSKQDIETECKKYSEQINKEGIDFQLLGIGTNGHIGFNEPGTPFNSLTHMIELSEKTRADNGRFFNDMNEVPTHAITMGMADIMSAKEIALVITGKHKAQTVLNLYNSPITEEMPASMLKQHANTHFFIDEAAASLLPKESQSKESKKRGTRNGGKKKDQGINKSKQPSNRLHQGKRLE